VQFSGNTMAKQSPKQPTKPHNGILFPATSTENMALDVQISRQWGLKYRAVDVEPLMQAKPEGGGLLGAMKQRSKWGGKPWGPWLRTLANQFGCLIISVSHSTENGGVPT